MSRANKRVNKRMRSMRRAAEKANASQKIPFVAVAISRQLAKQESQRREKGWDHNDRVAALAGAKPIPV